MAHPLGIIHGVDHLFTGKVERVDIDLLQKLLGQGILPVVPPLGFDGDGKTYRVNSDTCRLRWPKRSRQPSSSLSPSDDGLLSTRASSSGKCWPVTCRDRCSSGAAKELECRRCCRKRSTPPPPVGAGVPRVHIINGRVDEGLLAEVFSNEGIGTLIYANEYQQVRRALKKDIRNLMLTKNAVASDELVKRTRGDVREKPGRLLPVRDRQESRSPASRFMFIPN